MKIAAYVAGDFNIYYPSLVCLSSVKKYNNSDLFLFTEVSKLTTDQIVMLDDFGITPVDVEKLGGEPSCFTRI